MLGVYCDTYLDAYPDAHPCEDSPDNGCVYGEAYPDVYPDAHPCDAPPSVSADCPSQFSVCLQNNDGDPIRGALIFASTDQAGNDIVDVTITDKFGKAEFTGLEIGPYYATTKINGQTVDVRPFEVKN